MALWFCPAQGAEPIFLHGTKTQYRRAQLSSNVRRHRNHQTMPPASEYKVPHDKNVSPVGWYVASYLLRFVELNDTQRNEDDERFISWENTIVIKAKSLDQAFDKAMKVARQATKPYKGGPDGVPVQWELLGITDVLPIYEELDDGSEIAWTERGPRKLKNLKRMVRERGSFQQ